MKEKIKAYIKKYEEEWKHSIDMSPLGIQSATEKRMIKELKELVE